MPHMPPDQAPTSLWNSGNGSPEGVVTADVGAIYLRLDGGAATALYVKETGDNTNTGWVAYGLADASVTLAKMASITTDRLLGRDTAGTGVVETIEIGASLGLSGTGELRRSALTGDVTASANSNATTIAADAVTNAKLADMATATFKGRTTSGTGDPEDLTVTQATAMLNAATATVAGLVPTPPNNTTTFLRGDATFAAPVRTLWLWYGAAAVTAGSTDVFLNPAGIGTTPATTTSRPYSCPKTGTIVSVLYHTNTAHTTNTVTVEARINGTPTAVGPVSVTAGVTDLDVAVSPGVAVVRGDTISCQIDHNGATGLVNCLVGFEIQYT